LCPPPQATAYFSNRRQPGVVLRVSRMRTPVPRTAATKRAVSVATPESRCTKFKATRSAPSSARAGPATVSKTWPARTACPSRAQRRTRTAGESWRNAAAAKANPATTSGCRARMVARALAVRGTVASVVTSPAPRSSARAARTARRTALASSSRMARTCGQRAGGERKKATVLGRTLRAPP